ncbi:protein trichome birefringence-like 14 isoform X2 [Elaeis guineensis]|uniref:Protein trichome birefringence-like 14 isoform X2 n=1 Tax=Elaeis guineensis var. tenera TaxID=51953 RepID=A0A6J0PI77_ELAGV|nr:protein trichome birefringence-like 14 isoform X2 [Elaeis guineensis]
MKVGSLHGLRGKRLLLILVVICTLFLIWEWEKTPHPVNFIPSPDTTYLPPPVAHKTHTCEHATTEEEDFPVADDFWHAMSEREKQPFGVPSKGHKTTSSLKVTEVKKDVIVVAPLGKKGPSRYSMTEKAEQVLNVPPKDSAATSSVNTTEVDKNLKATSLEKKECNYGKGKWIDDDRRPLYSGFGCKQWLSMMWACRLTTRTDFSYEKYRWQPEGCEIQEFEGTEFLKRMQDKTIAFVGDSLGRQQFQSLMCMVTGGRENPEVEDVGIEFGFSKGDKRPSGWAYRFPKTRTTILYYWSSTLCELEPLNLSDPATGYAMHLDRPAAFLKQNLHRFDVLVLNTGHHWNRGKLIANRWEFYVGGVPNTNRRLREMGRAKNLTIHTVIKWLDSQLPQHPKLKAFLRSISPRHFFHGEWNTGGSCDNTSPLAHGYEVLQDASADFVAAAAVSGTRVKLLDITALSHLRDEGHISRYGFKASEGVHDCLHWCLPGIPDTWNEILAAQI